MGTTALAHATTLTAFLAGWGVGALAVSRRRSPVRVVHYFVAELLIGACGIGAAAAFSSLSAPSSLLPTHTLPILASTIDLVAAAVALLPSTFAAGAALPLLLRIVSPSASRAMAPSPTSVLYAAGLLGAAIGGSVAAIALLPRLGLAATVVAGALPNIAAALAAAIMLSASQAPASIRRDAPATQTAVLANPDGRRLSFLFVASCAAGAGVQMILNRILVPYAGVATLSFAAIAVAWIAAQFAGFVVDAKLEESGCERRAAMAAMALAPVVAGALACIDLFDAEIDRASYPVRWTLTVVTRAVVVAGPPAFVLAMLQAAVLRTPTRRAGAAADARLLACGSAAAAVAVLLTALVLVPRLGVRWSLVGLAAPLAVGIASTRRFRRAAAAIAFALAPVGVQALGGGGPAHYLGASFDNLRTIRVFVSAQDTTAIVEDDLPVEPSVRRLVSGGVSFTGDSVFAQRYMRLLGHLPALATTGRARALVICVGTGTTLDALRLHSFSRIDAVDLSPGVLESLDSFSHVNGSAHHDPRVSVVWDDGLRYLSRNRAPTYDVITVEPPPPRAPQASALYSAEFYRSAVARLRRGGVLAQWLPLHGITGDEAASIVATFIKVFPRGGLYLAERNEAVLLSQAPTRSLIPTVAPTEGLTRELARIGFEGLDALTSTFVIGPDGLRTAAAEGRQLRQVTRDWPGPEFTPLGWPAPPRPLAAWLDRVRVHATPVSEYAAIFSELAAPFARARSDSGSVADRERVTHLLGRLARLRPMCPYVQSMFGCGSLLAERLTAWPHVARNREVISGALARIADQCEYFERVARE